MLGRNVDSYLTSELVVIRVHVEHHEVMNDGMNGCELLNDDSLILGKFDDHIAAEARLVECVYFFAVYTSRKGGWTVSRETYCDDQNTRP
jgi:hypothetical protein